jgi:Protein of unknown function (DUF3040)
MASQYERQRLLGIERWFEAEDPDFARALRDGVPRRAAKQHRAITCVLLDLLGVGLFITGVVLSSLPLMMASSAVVATALCLHIVWPPPGQW